MEPLHDVRTDWTQDNENDRTLRPPCPNNLRTAMKQLNENANANPKPKPALQVVK